MKVNWESASEFGPESRILEIPVSWYLDDWPASLSEVHDRWTDDEPVVP
ncbi:MAG: Polysaccharide deacetylase [Actinoallomurus sp.]|nr:Polysaccharide deacetylase [Actinoallomurus sp.]